MREPSIKLLSPISPLLGQISHLPALLLRGLIWLYQKALSPALVVLAPSCGCRFAPTCSHYASDALRTHGLVAGIGLTFLRLAKCGPWHPGGLDPVPARTKPACVAVIKPASNDSTPPAKAALRSLGEAGALS